MAQDEKNKILVDFYKFVDYLEETRISSNHGVELRSFMNKMHDLVKKTETNKKPSMDRPTKKLM